MSWQQPIQIALKALRTEEATLRKQLETVQQKIRALEGIGTGRNASGAKTGVKKRKPMSAAGRAAIARAAKRRWARFRAEQRAKK